MRLEKINAFMQEHGFKFRYMENDDCGAIDFEHRGLKYHIWEYPAPERGAASNVLSCGRMEDYEEGYEDAILEILERDFL